MKATKTFLNRIPLATTGSGHDNSFVFPIVQDNYLMPYNHIINLVSVSKGSTVAPQSQQALYDFINSLTILEVNAQNTKYTLSSSVQINVPTNFHKISNPNLRLLAGSAHSGRECLLEAAPTEAERAFHSYQN